MGITTRKTIIQCMLWTSILGAIPIARCERQIADKNNKNIINEAKNEILQKDSSRYYRVVENTKELSTEQQAEIWYKELTDMNDSIRRIDSIAQKAYFEGIQAISNSKK